MHPNVARALEGCGRHYVVHRHADFAKPIHSPADFANQLNRPLGAITKTLLVKAMGADQYALVVASMETKLDFAKVAELLGARRVQVAPACDLQKTVGYPERGVSPIGTSAIPILIEEYVFRFPTVLVGAGEAGVEVEMAPEDLLFITNARRSVFSK